MLRRRTLPLLLAVWSLAPVLSAEILTFELDPKATFITFTFGATLHTVDGALQAKHGTVKFDTETGAASVKDMGRVMALLRERHAGEVDMGKASAAVKAPPSSRRMSETSCSRHPRRAACSRMASAAAHTLSAVPISTRFTLR